MDEEEHEVYGGEIPIEGDMEPHGADVDMATADDDAVKVGLWQFLFLYFLDLLVKMKCRYKDLIWILRCYWWWVFCFIVWGIEGIGWDEEEIEGDGRWSCSS